MDEKLNLEENAEIKEALKEFEIKNPEQVQTPSFVKDKLKDSEVPKMVQLAMKCFGIKEQKQAEYILLGFVILAIIVSLFLSFGGIGNRGAKPLTNNQIKQIIKNQQGMQTP